MDDTESILALLNVGLRAFPLAEGSPSAEETAELLRQAPALLVLDLEMSGPVATTHEVLDVGGVRASLAPGLPEERSWGSRVKPRHIGNAIPGALKVTGYSPKAWRDAMELGPAMAAFAELGEGAVVTGWGMGQDLAFLVESYRRLGLGWPFAPLALDVQPLARKLLKDGGRVDRFNLGHVADRLGIGRLGEHGALADAYATYDVLVKLLDLEPAP